MGSAEVDLCSGEVRRKRVIGFRNGSAFCSAVQTGSDEPDELRRVESERDGLEQGLKRSAAGQVNADAASRLAKRAPRTE